MKVIVVSGCSCSGKSTWVQNRLKNNDIVFDWDKLLQATTNRNKHLSETHPASQLIHLFRLKFIDFLKSSDAAGIDTAYMIIHTVSDWLKKQLSGLDVEYHEMKTTKEECLRRLEADDTRPDKEKDRKDIESYFSQKDGGKQNRGMKEIRISEIRALDPKEEGGPMRIGGTAIVFNNPAVIKDIFGSYTEIIRSSALDKTDLSDIRLLYNHDLGRVPLARTPKTLQLIKTAAGLDFEAALPETEEARSIYQAIRRGDVDGMSFGFKVPEGGDKYNPDTNTREITEIERLYELSITPFPQYPQTSVEARAVMERETTVTRNRAAALDLAAKVSSKKREAIITANQILLKEN